MLGITEASVTGLTWLSRCYGQVRSARITTLPTVTSMWALSSITWGSTALELTTYSVVKGSAFVARYWLYSVLSPAARL